MSDNLTVNDLYSLEEYSGRSCFSRESDETQTRQANSARSKSHHLLRKQDDYPVSSTRNAANRKDF